MSSRRSQPFPSSRAQAHRRRATSAQVALQESTLPEPFIKYPTWNSQSSSTAPPQSRRRNPVVRFDPVPRTYEPAAIESMESPKREPKHVKRRSRVLPWTVLLVLLSMFLGAVIQLKEGSQNPWTVVGLRVREWTARVIETLQGPGMWDAVREKVSEWLSEALELLQRFGDHAKENGLAVVERLSETVDRLKHACAKASSTSWEWPTRTID